MDKPEEAAARRAERKRARLSAPPPERDVAYDHLSVEDLRALRQQLSEEEGRVSYWRRIVQARIDLSREGSSKSGATVDGINRVLNEHAGAPRRIAYLRVQPVEGAAPLPELPRLWEHVTGVGDEEDAMTAALQRAEVELSSCRAELHRRIDAATAQLIARYREDPALALSALPSRSDRPARL